ncbi:type I-C CRISPR-associated protein Cas8c/Csd1 [Salinisphaera sp.]|uniref:type I-C CRISPR-associated protein Cas8c/Csd1 n=1 Tax=Salinisphaera sp. TaxID=1914330 RepID=UPI000C528A1F|nr:type I-C CRISPR-associated protein Cas8c/Csd1 [Salinisphaera sp.]MBS64248.1 type I-C CRISPR-associated protein Cas8c/Csd1 [Salinisphaera sp.]
MILTALNDYYQRLAAQQQVPQPGFSAENISFALVFSAAGEPLQIDDLRIQDDKGKFRPRPLYVPVDKRRTSGIHAYVGWDKTAYALGVTAGDGKRLADEHEAFKQRQRNLFADSDDPELRAFLALLEAWQPPRFHTLPGYHEELLDKNLVFRLDGQQHFVHEHPPMRTLWNETFTVQDSDSGPCLVTGEHAPLGLDHPAIRNVNGAQSSGASLISFNAGAYESYGHKGQANASISKQAIFGYSTALNHLLRRDNDNHQRLTIGDATVVFWAQAADTTQAEAAEMFFKALNEPPTDAQEAARLGSALAQVANGTALAETDLGLAGDTQFFVLGLAPNAARLSVRFWCVNTLEQLTRHFARHRQDLALDPLPWKGALPPIWRLLYAVAPSRDGRAKAEDIPSHLAGEIARAIFTGQRYPQSLLSNLVMRFRNDGDISGIRIALCKAVLTRNARLAAGQQSPIEEMPVSLDPHSTHPGYLLGRLFAELENAQARAIPNTNATIADRYYGAASATPASVFPLLLRNVKNHLAKLRKGNEKDQAIAGAISRSIREIVDGLDERLPKSLKIEDQGRFAIGYYHQTQARFNKKKPSENTETPEDQGDAQ